MARKAARPFAPPQLGEMGAPVEQPVLDGDAPWTDSAITGDFTEAAAAHMDISGCRITNSRFSLSVLDELRATDVAFVDCEFSGAQLPDLAATRVEFRRCRMSGVVLTGGRWNDVRFDDCKLDGANLRMTKGDHVEFDDCVLDDADFYGALLPDARFRRCHLARVEFSKAKLEGATLHGSTIEDVRGGDSLRGVKISSEQIVPVALAVFAATGIVIDDDNQE